MGSSSFDPLRFWIHGGPLFFGDELSKKVVSGHDPTSTLPCDCGVQMDTADDDEVRQVVLYHLNMNHISAEIREMDLLQFSSFSRKDKILVNQCRDSPIQDMADIWGPYSGGGVQPHFLVNKKCWVEWLFAVRRVTMEWSGFDTWDWKGLKDVRSIDLGKLSHRDFHTATLCLLTFFINTFISRLGYYPSPMLCPPALATHSCSKHRKSFLAGH
jgi:predicted small metal-binding protein